MKARVRSEKGGKIVVRTSGENGKPIAELPVKATNGWVEMNADVSYAPAGIQNLTVVSGGEYPVAIDWISFE